MSTPAMIQQLVNLHVSFILQHFANCQSVRAEHPIGAACATKNDMHACNERNGHRKTIF